MYSHCKKTSITYYIQKLNEYINFTTGVLHCDDCDRFLIDNKDRVVILYGALHTYYEKIGVLIPERITEIREDLGLNKKEFGEYLSISQGMVHKYRKLQSCLHQRVC